MTTWLGVCIWLLGALLSLSAVSGVQHEPRVVCYYTNWSVYRPGTATFNPLNINPYLCTHLIYAFGGFTKENTLKPFDKYQDVEKGGYAKFVGLKTYNKNLKTMLALGGWNEGSTRFSPMVANATRRGIFVKNAVKFLRQNKFDGLDLDWEYPSFRDGGKPRDRDNYAQFVQELREEFEKESSKTGRTRLLLTMAVPAGLEYVDKGYDVPKLNKYLDWMNLLTYDYHSSFEPAVNHHAPLYSLEEESEYNYDAELNIHHTIKHYLAAGAERHKLVLGIPTYGRSYTLINPEANEIGAPSDGPGEQGDATREKGYLAYYEICESLKSDDSWTVVQPNQDAMGPYAYRGDQWVGYDDEAMVRKKAQYVVEQGLGGIMFWAIDNDDFRGTCHGKPYPLIEAAKESLLEGLSGIKGNDVDAPVRNPTKKPSTRRRPQVKTSSSVKSTAVTARPTNRRISSRRKTSTTTSTTEEPVVLSDESGSSLYIGGRTTTPAPPTTPDPGSDFKCEDEGFFPHPRDCKKYFWCLDSGPSNLGIVAHQFSCPSGLLFNKAADSCDYARNVHCKTKKDPPAEASSSSTTTTTTTQKPSTKPPRISRVTLRTTARTTTTTTSAPEYEEYEYEDVSDEKDHTLDSEEDPRVIKELIDLIRKVGGIEKLEKQLDGIDGLQSESSSGSSTTPATISRSLYERVLSKATHRKGADAANRGSANNKYTSFNRKVPQFSGGDSKEEEGRSSSRGRPQYVTIQRNRPHGQEPDEDSSVKYSQEVLAGDSISFEDDFSEEHTQEQPRRSTQAPSHGTQQYVNIRRARPTTEENVVEITTRPKSTTTTRVIIEAPTTTTTEYVPTISRRPVYIPSTTIKYEPVAREDTLEELDISHIGNEKDVGDESIISTTSGRYKSVERLRPIPQALTVLSNDDIQSTVALDATSSLPSSSPEVTTLVPPKTTINIISSETPAAIEQTTPSLTTKPENIPVTIVTRLGGLTSKSGYSQVTSTARTTTQDATTPSKSTQRPYPFTKRLYQSQTKDRFRSSERKRPAVLSTSAPSTGTTVTIESPKVTSESVEVSSRRSTKLRSRYRLTTEAGSSASPTYITSSTSRSRDGNDFGNKSEQNKSTLTNRRRNLFRRKQSTSTTVSQETTTALSNNVASPTEAPPRKVQFRKRLPTTSIVPETTVIPQVSVTPPAITLTTPVHDQQALTSLREAESIEDSESDIRKQKLRPDDTLDNLLRQRGEDIDSAEGVIAMAIRRLVHAPLPPSKFLEDSVLTTPSYSKINRVNYGIQEPANIPAVLTFSTTARPIMRTPLESSIYYREPQPFSLTPSTPRYIAQRPVYDYDYPDIHPIRFEHSQPQYKGLKNGVLVHSTGALECLDQGTFPHPASCRRFVVCSRMQRGPLVGWQYTCPKGLSYDPVGGICNWAAGLGCKD